MKDKIFLKILYIITCIIQLIALLSGFVIEYLTKKKAGVMHHVYYRKYQFANGIFSAQNIQIMNIVFISLCILFFMILIYTIKKGKSKFYKDQVLIASIISFLIYIVINNNYFIERISYYYFIIFFIVALIIQILNIFIYAILNKNKS